MSRMLIAVVATLVVASLSGCANDQNWIGKGKGKAPPPEPAPVEQPVIK